MGVTGAVIRVRFLKITCKMVHAGSFLSVGCSCDTYAVVNCDDAVSIA